MIITIVFSEKVIILLFKDGGGQGLCCYNPRQKSISSINYHNLIYFLKK